jgi:hypothetical protein
MKKLLLALGATVALGGCASDYYGPGPYPINGAPVYDAYYDGGYGGFYDGYWGPNDVFFYSRGPRGRYIADRGGHFRHDVGPGGHWNSVRGHGPGPGAHFGGGGFHGGGFHGGGGHGGGHGPH